MPYGHFNRLATSLGTDGDRRAVDPRLPDLASGQDLKDDSFEVAAISRSRFEPVGLMQSHSGDRLSAANCHAGTLGILTEPVPADSPPWRGSVFVTSKRQDGSHS